MLLKYQQQLKIIYTTKSECPPSCLRGLLKAIYCLCVRLCQLLLWVKTQPPNLFFWPRIPIDVRVKAIYDSYCPNSFLICILFAIYLIWEFETSTLLIIG